VSLIRHCGAKVIHCRRPENVPRLLSQQAFRGRTLGASPVSTNQAPAGVLHKTAHLGTVIEAVRSLRRGETLITLEEVVEMLRYATRTREQ
jgi:hypothetical protein